MAKKRSPTQKQSNSDAQLTKDVLAHIIDGAKYHDLQSPERTVRKYLGIYYDVILDELNDCARRALMETPGGQSQTFHPVVPTEAEKRRAKIPEALHQFIDMDVLEEAVSFFGKAGRPAALCPEEERRLYHYTVYRVQRNMPLLKQDFLQMVSKYLGDTGRTRTITLTRKRESALLDTASNRKNPERCCRRTGFLHSVVILSASASKALKKPRGKTTSFCLTAQEAVAFMRNKVADENQRRTEKEAKAQKRQQSATRSSSVSTASRPQNTIRIRSYNGGEGSSTLPYVPASQQPAAEAAGTAGIQPTGMLSSIQAANRRFAQN
eukprot:ANDGO_04790.mRNA.1 hypothetical protein